MALSAGIADTLTLDCSDKDENPAFHIRKQTLENQSHVIEGYASLFRNMPSKFRKIDEENGAAPSSLYRSSRIDNTF
ncbi:hypothetical protein [Shewanella mangrovisoli]|uniref:hypothetical protein n=1 Tax=Shewanella mangrovisoli TaxID=2864211 RepID=UPI0035B83F39